MEVTALCVRLLMNLLMMLLVAHVEQSYPQTSDAAFRIVPTRLQVFEYGRVSFTCEGFNVSAGWKVRNINENLKYCSDDTETSTVTCTIDRAFASDSGEYRCEGGGGERSNTVNITVTAGPVILDSPVLPVMEGDAVTLRCRNKDTSSNITADFYKGGAHVGTSSTGEMTIHSVSKSDEGLYRCNTSDTEESPESWLTVRVITNQAVQIHTRDGLGLKSAGAASKQTVVTSQRLRSAPDDPLSAPQTIGSVILDSPVLPVMEGNNVTLRCRNKTTSSKLTAGFYKDGLLMGSSSTGEMIIHRVSKSDEGLYKCNISDAGESPESWLAVRAPCPSSDHFLYVLLLLRTVFTVVMVPLLLLLVGLLHCGKLPVTHK